MIDPIERADALAAIAIGDTVNQLQAKIRALPAVTLPDDVAKVVEEAGKVLEEVLRVDPFNSPLAAANAEQAAADTIRALTAIITAQAAQIAGLEAADRAQAEVIEKQAETIIRINSRAEAAEARIAALTATVERMRGALELIAATTTPPVAAPWTHSVAADTYWQMIDRMKFTARAAITEEPK